MVLLDQKLNDFKKRINGWTPHNGFQQTELNFEPADIIFGRRISAAVKRHGCCDNPESVMNDIRIEAEKSNSFKAWFIAMEPHRLQTLCEFLIYRKPPH